MSHLIVNGVDKTLDHIYVNTGSVVKEAWEARDKNDHLLWGRADTFIGTNSISARCYGLPVKSWSIDGKSQQTGTPALDNIIMPTFCGDRTANLFDGKTNIYPDSRGVMVVGTTCISSVFDISNVTHISLSTDLYLLNSRIFRIGLSNTPIIEGSTTTRVSCGNETIDVSEYTYACIACAYNSVPGSSPEKILQATMVNAGSTSFPYEPHGYKISLTSAGQTQDVYLGQVPTTRRVLKLVLTGQETYSVSTASNVYLLNVQTNPAIYTANKLSVLCTHYNGVPNIRAIDLVLGEICLPITLAGNYIAFKTTFSSKDDFIAYIAQQYTNGTPVTVWYVLANEQTSIVNEPLMKIGSYADTITSEQVGVTLPTNDGTTTISVGTTIAPSSMTVKVHAKPIHYGFKIDKSVSDPSNAVIYTHDAVTMTPAGMDFTNGVFDYGSWENVWFIKNARPVMLNFDGTEAYDLDPNDYSKKLDGTPSDITDSTKNMNAMIAFPTVWIKRTDDGSYNYIEISDRQLDSDFHAYAHEDANGVVKPYIYLPIYKGSIVDGKLRSISGVKPQSGTTAQQEVDAASALGIGWQIWDYTSKEMLCDLLTLISKSLDTQGKFGQGHSIVGSSASDFLDCGTLNDKGKFFGYSATTSQVKCFGMEALWAERCDRELGLILDAGIYKIKEHPAYNLTGEGYTAITTSVAKCPTSDNYIKTEVSTQFGSLPTVVGGTQSTYYCDYFYQNQSGVRVAIRGCDCNRGAIAGLRCVNVNNVASASYRSIGASPVYK